MKSWFPFSDYDFFGYLAVGGGLLLAVDNAFQVGWITKTTWTWLEIAAFIGAAYAAGQATAAASHRLLEQMLVHGAIGAPSAYLMGNRTPRSSVHLLFARFTKPLPREIQERIKARATALDIGDNGEALFLTALSVTRERPFTQERLATFLSRYGLFRNSSLASVAAALVWFAQSAVNADNNFLLAGTLALAFALLCFFRFLTFYRHFAQEVLTTFAFYEER